MKGIGIKCLVILVTLFGTINVIAQNDSCNYKLNKNEYFVLNESAFESEKFKMGSILNESEYIEFDEKLIHAIGAILKTEFDKNEVVFFYEMHDYQIQLIPFIKLNKRYVLMVLSLKQEKTSYLCDEIRLIFGGGDSYIKSLYNLSDKKLEFFKKNKM